MPSSKLFGLLVATIDGVAKLPHGNPWVLPTHPDVQIPPLAFEGAMSPSKLPCLPLHYSTECPERQKMMAPTELSTIASPKSIGFCVQGFPISTSNSPNEVIAAVLNPHPTWPVQQPVTSNSESWPTRLMNPKSAHLDKSTGHKMAWITTVPYELLWKAQSPGRECMPLWLYSRIPKIEHRSRLVLSGNIGQERFFHSRGVKGLRHVKFWEVVFHLPNLFFKNN